jgi:hypothetical protein
MYDVYDMLGGYFTFEDCEEEDEELDFDDDRDFDSGDEDLEFGGME